MGSNGAKLKNDIRYGTNTSSVNVNGMLANGLLVSVRGSLIGGTLVVNEIASVSNLAATRRG